MRLAEYLVLVSLALAVGNGCGGTSASSPLVLDSLVYDTVAGPCPPAMSCHWKLTVDASGTATFDDAGTPREGAIPPDPFDQFRTFIGTREVVDTLRNETCPLDGQGLDTQSAVEVAFSNAPLLMRNPVEACHGPDFDALASWMGRFEQGLRGGTF
jgi:hypothetical protein